jgi:hypothetical protein
VLHTSEILNISILDDQWMLLLFFLDDPLVHPILDGQWMLLLFFFGPRATPLSSVIQTIAFLKTLPQEKEGP